VKTTEIVVNKILVINEQRLGLIYTQNPDRNAVERFFRLKGQRFWNRFPLGVLLIQFRVGWRHSITTSVNLTPSSSDSPSISFSEISEPIFR